MVVFVRGDILKSDAEALVNTVNCVGYMGRGIALQFKRAYPENFAEYAAACGRGDVVPGRMFVHERHALGGPRYIVNFPTKRHWRGRSRTEDIEAGLVDLARVIHKLGIKSVAVPPLGCGLGGLDWSDVGPRIAAALGDLPDDVRVLVFEPSGAPAAAVMVKSSKAPRMTAGRAVLVTLMHRYLAGLMDPFVSLLEVHKLMYFAQEAGEPLKLAYKKASHGPYAENLRQVLSHVEGHFVTGYADGGDDPHKQLDLVPGAFEDARKHLQGKAATRKRFERVADLVDGFESPFGMELLATVHWLVQHEGLDDVTDIVNGVYSWGSQKHGFTRDQIVLALDVLREKGWVPSSATQH